MRKGRWVAVGYMTTLDRNWKWTEMVDVSGNPQLSRDELKLGGLGT